MKFSRFRTFLLTFAIGLAIVGIYARLSGYLDEIPVEVPKTQYETPLVIRVCPEPVTLKERNKLNKKFNGGSSGGGSSSFLEMCHSPGGGG